MSDDEIYEMEERIRSGEFGSPPDLALVNEAWNERLNERIIEVRGGDEFHPITGLWPRAGQKVAFDGRAPEDITIPQGSKILCFYGNPEPGTRQPEYRLVYVTNNQRGE